MEPNTSTSSSHAPSPSAPAPPSSSPPREPFYCYICTEDEKPTDKPNTWVQPCLCNNAVHQTCLLIWVEELERENKPVECGACKTPLQFDNNPGPVAALSDAIGKRFSRVSPYMIFTGAAAAVHFSSQLYGAVALSVFAGQETMVNYMLIEGSPARATSRNVMLQRLSHASVLTAVAPTLLMSHLFPSFTNRILLYSGSLYAIFQNHADPSFASWPPSPQLAIAIFPFVRSVYYNLWREFVFPHELKYNRKILGLPPTPPTETRNGNANGNVNGNGDANRDGNAARRNRRNARRDRAVQDEGGILGLLQALLDLLEDGEEDEQDRPQDLEGAAQGDGEGNDIPIFNAEDVEIVGTDEAEPVAAREAPADQDEPATEVAETIPIDNDIEERLAELEAEVDAEIEVEGEVIVDIQIDAGGAVPEAAPANAQEQDQDGRGDFEVPGRAPLRPTIGSILRSFSNTVVGALILPGISFAMGEALRLVLPRRMTDAPLLSRWAYTRVRPGMLQEQWGRSLVGGCLYVVVKDVVRFYAKKQKAEAKDNRRLKNHPSKRVTGREGGNGGGGSWW